MEISVSDLDGHAVAGLKPKNFTIHHLASRNHAIADARAVKAVQEAPSGFYIVTLKPDATHANLPPGTYILAVVVHSGIKQGGKPAHRGQALAVADLTG